MGSVDDERRIPRPGAGRRSFRHGAPSRPWNGLWAVHPPAFPRFAAFVRTGGDAGGVGTPAPSHANPIRGGSGTLERRLQPSERLVPLTLDVVEPAPGVVEAGRV